MSTQNNRDVAAKITGNVELITKVTLTDLNGDKHNGVNGHGSSRGGDDRDYHFSFEHAIAKDARFNIELRTDTIELEVPFTCTNVSITK